MSIIRAPRPEVGYLQISNDVLRDTRLHLRSLGLLVRVLSRPDNWETSAERLAKECHEGRDALATALRELREAGYMRQEKWQGPDGRWTTVTYVYDSPNAAPAAQPAMVDGSELSPLVTPGTGNQGSADQGSADQGSESQGLLRRTEKNNQQQGELLPSMEESTPPAAEPEALTPPSRIDVQRVCNHLAANIRANGAKAVVTKQWLLEARRLIDLDGRDENEVHRVIEWATHDFFWASNILSVPTLRRKYDQLRLRMLAERPQQAPPREHIAAQFSEGPAPEFPMEG